MRGPGKEMLNFCRPEQPDLKVYLCHYHPVRKDIKKIITKLIEPFATLLPSHASQEMQPISYTNSLLQCHVTRTAYPGNPPYSLQLLLYLKPTYPLSMRLEVAGYIPGEKDFSTNFANFFHSLHVF